MHLSKRGWLSLLIVGLALGWAAASARADDKKADPNGTWKWSFERPDGTKMDFSLKLKKEGDKVTGNLTGGPDNAESEIQDGKIKDGEVSFKIKRERNGQAFTVHYKGKIEGDQIKGKFTFGQGDNARSRDWEAKRASE
jgi:hypothetical protein